MNDAEATAGIIDCLEAGAKDYPPVKIKPIAISADAATMMIFCLHI